MTTATNVTTRNHRIKFRPFSYEFFHTLLVRRLRNSEIVNFAIHKLSLMLSLVLLIG